MNRPGLAILALLALVVSLSASPSLAAEEILDWHSDIVVQADGHMIVSETLRVRAEGQQIRRGIFRDFPTTYRNRFGNRVRVGFELISVERDGRPEPNHIGKLANGVRIYAGDKDVMLPPGVYTYTITYRTDRQLGFFEDHDELYWNVTGNGWVFPILRASASVVLPPGIPMDQVRAEAYTGPEGSREKAYTSRIEGHDKIVFETTRPLGPLEGLTIVAGWPKGYILEPGAAQRASFFFLDNLPILAVLGGMLLLILYYLRVWTLVGRDPEKGTIIPLFEPPDGLSPAAARYIREMDFDNRAFTSAVLNLAVKGYLKIFDEDKALGIGRDYTLRKNEEDPGASLSKGEKKLLEKLFPPGETDLPLEKPNHARISGAISALRELLKDEYKKSLFLTNRAYMAGGIFISAAVLLIWAFLLGSGESDLPALFALLWLVPWAFGTFALWGGRQYFPAALFTFFLVAAAAFFAFAISLFFIVSIVIIVGINLLFIHLLKAPTALGRKVMDRIEGFRMYLSIAEEDRLEKLHPPGKTPELFERYLPYALALDVDQQWSEKFADVLKQAAETRGYSPAWYYGGTWDGSRPGMFTSDLGSSLSSAITSSSTPPGSSSGSGGGGSSGGGGGGGGGGGW